MESLGISIPQVLLDIEYYDGPEQRIREEANADVVGLISCLTYKENHDAAEMANKGELMNVLDALVPFTVER